MFYGSGDCLVLNIPTSDSDDIPEIVRRLEEISIGCQVKQIFLPGFLVASLLYACIYMTKCQSKFLKSKFSKDFTRTKLSFVASRACTVSICIVPQCETFVVMEELFR